MNDPHLIEKHLADGLGEEGTAELDAALCSDPESARRLVAAARLDERLVAKLGAGRTKCAWPVEMNTHRRTANGSTRWWRPLAMAAALVLALALAVAMNALWRSFGSPRSESIAATHPAPKRPFVPAVVLPVADRPEAPQSVEKETPAMTSLRQFLATYYLSDLQLDQPTPLPLALERLIKRGVEVNHLKNPLIERLTAEVELKDSDNAGSSSPDVAVPLEHISLMDGLKWIAALTHSEVFLKEPGVIIFRPWEPDEDNTMVTEVLRIRPDLLTRPRPAEAPEEDAVATRSGAGSPPDEGITETTPVPRFTPIELFQSWGISFTGQASASFDEATSALTICQSAPTMRMIKELLAIEGSRTPHMISISTKVFEFAQGRSVENEVLTDQQFQIWLKAQNQSEGVELLSSPQVMTRSGQRVMVEVVLKADRPLPERVDRPEKHVDWQGLRIGVEPVFEGEVVNLVGAVELRLPIDRKPGQLLPDESTPSAELATTATEFEGLVPDGQTALFALSEVDNLPSIVVSVTVNRMESGGQSTGESEPAR